MSTNTQSAPATSGGVAGTAQKRGDYDDCVPMQIDSEAVMPKQKVDKCWEALYKKIGFASLDEKSKRQIRCAVFTYGLLNGTSSVGQYAGMITSNSGKAFAASALVAVVGQLDMRRFFRGNAKESLEFFRAANAALSEDPAIRALCVRKSIRPEGFVALADWFDYYDGLTPAELAENMRLKDAKIERAFASRGAKTVDDIRDDSTQRSIAAQGTVHHVAPPTGAGW